ncbi:hypothetical protein HALLA_04865 [Halostagnicola larsenii XH-48]|uniref:Antitoxin n=1 Tax=Halostagnicola larsenii XH-48 TaxID=797299 RepID=W0JMC9_9EURY|nr:antitoxin VapB family protein [Halostagnicola larsenii]AHF98304.1 hypothetical protein HALLA_04865 [Halostagnicola larsenii XH-48]
MATKSLTVTEEAYEHLKAYKREDESFTDTILRLTDADRDVMKGFGAFENDEGFRNAAETARAGLNEDIAERRERHRDRRDRDSER